MPTNLIKKVQNTVFQYNLFERGDKIVLGVSGGPDSTAMLDIFSKLRKKYSLELIIAHVNYGLRGRDSERDEKFVREMANSYGYPFLKLGFRKILKPSFRTENELRNIRYAFFEKIRSEKKFDYIAVAHNADDQVETFLARVIRGAGLLGLSAMRYKNEKIIRPLLNIPRSEILEYLKKNNLDFRVDKTNLESKYARNIIRNDLLPYLEKKFNPAIRKTIFDATVSIAEDYALISDLTEKEYKKLKDFDVKKI
ncbi:MAG: tRNA lysidine(34) synthetase TilS, partial [Candidatus Moranbacteria bacterium RIFOXYA2_FULL_43_15]